MNIVKRLDQYNGEYVYFCDPIINNIIINSNFIRILYSNGVMTLSGIYLMLNINHNTCEKHYNKYKCIFNPETYSDIIMRLKIIECELLSKINIINKTPQYKIYEQLSNGFIKSYNEIIPNYSTNFILKISGIWETQNSYGLTYKFVVV